MPRITSSPYDALITQIIEIERQPQLRLEAEREEQSEYKSILSALDSKISTLHTTLDSFFNAFDNPFDARTVQIGEGVTAFTATAAADAAQGTHRLEIERLAATDIRLSKQYTAGGGALRAFFDANGAQTFSISVAHPTDADPANRVNIDVSVDPAGTTDEEILDEIALAVNAAMDAAGDAGTIEADERAHMSVVNETSGTARLSLRSGQTGYTYRLGFTDSPGGLLTELDINAGTVVAPGSTAGGQVTDVGTSQTNSLLNSKFILDGLTLYRDGNSVDDAIEGVTLNFSTAGEPAADFTVTADSESVIADVKSFIEQYNAVITYISNQSEIDPETDTRGEFADDYTIRNLRFDMRTAVTQEVASQPAGAPNFLYDLGLDINRDGTLSLTDEGKLTEAIESNADAVQSFFANSTDGVAKKLQGHLEQFIGFDGVIDIKKGTADTRIDRLDDRIADWETRLIRREEQLRLKYARLQEALSLMQGQLNIFGLYSRTV